MNKYDAIREGIDKALSSDKDLLSEETKSKRLKKLVPPENDPVEDEREFVIISA